MLQRAALARLLVRPGNRAHLRPGSFTPLGTWPPHKRLQRERAAATPKPRRRETGAMKRRGGDPRDLTHATAPAATSAKPPVLDEPSTRPCRRVLSTSGPRRRLPAPLWFRALLHETKNRHLLAQFPANTSGRLEPRTPPSTRRRRPLASRQRFPPPPRIFANRCACTFAANAPVARPMRSNFRKTQLPLGTTLESCMGARCWAVARGVGAVREPALLSTEAAARVRRWD